MIFSYPKIDISHVSPRRFWQKRPTRLLVAIFFCLAISLDIAGVGQQNPSLNTTIRDATCGGDGAITASLAGVSEEEVSNVAYSLYLAPIFNEPLASNSSGNFSGLAQGNYRIRATGDLNESRFSVESNVVVGIENQGVEFTISAQNICLGDDGTLEAVVVQGVPTSYELRGPVNYPPQSSPFFSDLREGQYTLVVMDECGDAYSKNYQLLKPQFNIDATFQDFRPILPSCDRVSVGHKLTSSDNSFAFPVTVDIAIFGPDGQPVTATSTELEEADLEEGVFYAEIPLFHGTPYSYTIQTTDLCGVSTEPKQFSVNRSIAISDDLRWGAGLCGKRRLSIKPQFASPPFTIQFTSFPEGFDPAMANPNYPGPFTEDNVFFGSVEDPIPDGLYSITLSDACGNTTSMSVDHKTIVGAPSATVLKSCTPGYASLELMNFDYFLESVTLVDGPSEFSPSYPIDLSQHISQADSRRFFLAETPSGEYTFEVKTSCGDEIYRRTYQVNGSSISSEEAIIEENCGTFDVLLNHLSDIPNSQNLRFGLQKKDPKTGVWGHPHTGTPYEEGQELTDINAVLLSNGRSNLNLAFTGDLRIVKSVRVFKNGADILPGALTSFTHCSSTFKEFNFVGRTKLESINFFSCGNDFFDVYFSEEGYEPVTYSIISMNGIPVDIQNGTNPLFSNLEAGRYKFRMVDRCGNTTTSSLTLFGSNLPAVTPTNLCEGESGELQVPFFEQVKYEWFLADTPEVILSTENTLKFESFSIESHAGVYHVRISHPDPESCINETLEFTIDAEQLNGQAGTGQEATVCFGETVDLFDYLATPFGLYGTWQDLGNSGQLTGNLWNTEGLAPGIYEFGYQIFGLCSGDDETVVTLTLLPPIESPEGELVQEFCAAENLTLENLQVSGENLRWYTTPEGGQLLSSTTALQNEATYYAEQVVDGCPSSERLAVTAKIHPVLSGASIQGNQVVFQLQPIDPLTGQEPQGGRQPYTYRWENSVDGETWTEIPDASTLSLAPEPVMENTFFRLIVVDPVCGELVSNEVLVETKTAPIQANDDRYGPLKGFENNLLDVSANDEFMERPIELGEVTYAVISVADENGNDTPLQASFDQNGNLMLPAGTVPGNYLVRYQICQAGIPENCSSATASIWVGAIDISLEKSVDRQRAVEGEILTFYISGTNNSPFDLENITLEDILPEGLLFLSASSTPASNFVWQLEYLAIQERFEIAMDVMAVRDGEYVNEVRVSAGDFEGTANSPTVIVRVRESELSLKKTVSPEEVEDGDEFYYQLVIQNGGIDEGTDVSIFDRLPAGVQYKGWEFESTASELIPTLVHTGNMLTWNVPRFPVNTSLTIRIHVVGLAEGTFTNEAWVSSEAFDPNTANNASQVSKRINRLFIPNVIKPDNDGKNETFVIRADHKFDKTELVIFNRWGDPVYESDDYQNDWDATGLNSGTYYYQVSGNLASGEKILYKGWVQVIK